MTVRIHDTPKLADLLQVCSEAPRDERKQYAAFTGEAFDADRVAARLAASLLTMPTWPAWVITADGTPIVAAGFSQLRPGVWQDWMVSTPAAWDTHWRAVTRLARKVMDSMLRGDAHRLQCVALASRTKAHRWYRALGLAPEGVLYGYGVRGEDAVMYARTRPYHAG